MEQVNRAAGRGMGLSASRRKVESFGGKLNLHSAVHEGTTFTIQLPLTMSIAQALLVRLGEETYCIPFSSVFETLKIAPQSIKTVEHEEMISYRGSVLPLIRLRCVLGFPPADSGQGNLRSSRSRPSIPVVVVESGAKKAGFIVDALEGQQEVVIKPLKGILKTIRGVSGATILGSGKTALILDIPALF
jgi:two-component system chemotaxis sensor kinase CheA